MTRRELARELGMPDHVCDPTDDEDAELATDDPCWEPDECDKADDDEA
jgi:hypothetical protein